jgi:hypothetical protein
MPTIIKNILVVIIGLVLGGVVNSGLITLSPHVIPPPSGADFTTVEGLQQNVHLMQPKHFIFPFLAHALGTLIGALFVSKFSTNKNLCYIIGGMFLLGGIMAVKMIPAPMWFNVLDLVVAYLPMAFIATKFEHGKLKGE